MFLFIENLAGLQIATYSPALATRRLVTFVTPGVMVFAEPAFRQRRFTFTISAPWLRVLKPLLSLAQFPVIQQDPYGWAFRLSLWKQVLSDGLLTEFIVKCLRVPVRHFYSIGSVCSDASPVVPGCAIIGSNWLEFGSMSEHAYRAHLEFLQRQFPQAVYYCHPKEHTDLPEQVFGGSQVRRPDRPVEALLRTQGIPQLLAGVCSSSLLALAVGNAGRVQVHMVCLHARHLDGARGHNVFMPKRPAGGMAMVSVDDLQQFLLQELAACHVQVRQVEQTP